ncbi:MAG: preprotein translocase subunit YajC [Planctomycetota bacterium]
MSKRIVVGLGILLVLSLPLTPAGAQEGDEGQWADVPAESNGGEQAAGESAPPAGEQAEGNGEQGATGEEGQKREEGPAGPRPDGGLLSGWTLPLLLIGVLVLMYVWMGRSRKKQEQKRKEMLSTLKKGDKIMSIGGVLGTVIEARPDELVVKVDEANNVRMRFARWAVRAVGEEAQSEASKDQPQG